MCDLTKIILFAPPKQQWESGNEACVPASFHLCLPAVEPEEETLLHCSLPSTLHVQQSALILENKIKDESPSSERGSLPSHS